MIFDDQSFLLMFSALLMGFLVPRATTCAVAAVNEFLDKGSAWRFLGFFVATLAVLLVLVPISALGILPVRFSPIFDLHVLVALGGLLFGMGAGINGACVFGTLTKIVSGDGSYLFVLPGLWLGAVAIGASGVDIAPTLVAPSNILRPMGPIIVVWFFGLLAFLITLGAFWRARRLEKALWMTGIGVSGGLLYTLHPFWNYSSVVYDLAQDAIKAPHQMGDDLLPWLVVCACFGGLISTVAAGTFRIRLPNPKNSFGALIGGFLMAFGLVMIPGGNDSLVLFVIPSLVPAGFLAYLTMNVGIVLTQMAGRYFLATPEEGAA